MKKGVDKKGERVYIIQALSARHSRERPGAESGNLENDTVKMKEKTTVNSEMSFDLGLGETSKPN